jgi:PEP-CTERM motif
MKTPQYYIKKTFTSISVLAGIVALSLIPNLAAADPDNGGSGLSIDDPPVTVGASWFETSATPPAFFWSGGNGATNAEGPFTFTALSTVTLYVTDAFDVGDRFQVFDFGSSIGLTSVPSGGAGSGTGDPNIAFTDPSYSSGTFQLNTGAHSITFTAIASPFGGGRAYLQVLPAPEPATLTLAGLGGLALLARIRRKSRR